MQDFTMIYGDSETVPLFSVTIDEPGANRSVSLFSSADRVDGDARSLSAMFPQASIVVGKSARVKAVYKAGERVSLFDYHNFYCGLTERDYAATLIRDSRTGELV